jgi:hypothetical protein
MRTTIVVLSLAALSAACGKKKTEAPPPGPEKIIAPDVAPMANCPSLLPNELRAQYFAGLAMSPTPPQKTGSGTLLTCIFSKPGAEQQVVQVNCSAIAPSTLDQDMKEIRTRMTDVKELSGIGKQAFVGTENGKKILRFVDDDTRCYGVITSSPNAEAVAKALVAVLTPDTIKR